MALDPSDKMREEMTQKLAHFRDRLTIAPFLLDDPTSYDKPSLLSDQLRWLHEAGFPHADCFWLQAGHAIYGGYK